MINSNSIPIVEIFEGHQGEGSTQGRPALFIRVAGCNMNCIWCDTQYALKRSQGKKYNLTDLLSLMTEHERIVLTGGEPLLYKDQLLNIVFDYIGVIEVETNGTISPLPPAPKYLKIQYNVSPKLSSSNVETTKAIKPEILKEFVKLDSIFKFVIGSNKDWNEMIALIKKINIPHDKVYVTPQATSREELLEKLPALQAKALQYKFNISSRLHIIIYDRKQGV